MLSFKLFLENEEKFLKKQILKSHFLKDIQNNGGRLYFVGGAIRDEYLNKPSKDVDVTVSGIPFNELATILERHGKVDKVGQSFGIIKFKPNEFPVKEPLDIALPRTERPMTDEEKEQYRNLHKKYPTAHQSFTVRSDHAMDIIEDLKRRDFTINALARDPEGNLIDPFNGMRDIQNKIIRMVDPKAFSQDPLRMLRAIQFAARFGFEIEPNTFNEISSNSELINAIAGERILTELEKIVFKGDQYIGAKLLCKTGLWKIIAELPCGNLDKKINLFSMSKNVSEFIFIMLKDMADTEKAIEISRKLKCDLITMKQIKSLYLAWYSEDNPHKIVFKMNRIHPSSLNLKILPDRIINSINSNMPKSYKDLMIDGNKLTELGYEGKGIGEILDNILNAIFEKRINNQEQDILNFIQQTLSARGSRACKSLPLSPHG